MKKRSIFFSLLIIALLSVLMTIGSVFAKYITVFSDLPGIKFDVNNRFQKYTYAVLDEDTGVLSIRYRDAVVTDGSYINKTAGEFYLVDKDGTYKLGEDGVVWELPCEAYSSQIPTGANTDWDKLRGVIVDSKITVASPVTSVEVADALALKGSLAEMFSEFSNAETIDLRKASFESVTDMRGMFNYCLSVENIYFNNDTLDTKNVTDMSKMFYHCSALENLDVSKLSTGNVVTMEGMFAYCSKLTSLVLTGFDTQNVTTMKEMFFKCTGLAEADFSSFKTDNVKSMRYMFDNCAFKKLDLSSFNTSKVTDMYAMFVRCGKLEELWFTNSCLPNTDIGYMFQGVRSLKIIYSRDNWNIPHNNSLFIDCTSLNGSNGNKYNTQNISSDYAWIDNDSGRPGYLTYIGEPLLRSCITDVGVSGGLNSDGTSVEVTLTAINGTLPSGVRIISSKESVADYVATINNGKVTIPSQFCTSDQVVSLFPYGADVIYTFAVLDGETFKVYNRNVTIEGTTLTLSGTNEEIDMNSVYALPITSNGSYDITSRSWHNAIDQATKIEFMDEIVLLGSAENLFLDFKKITDINLLNESNELLLNIDGVTTIKGMFQNCTALTKVRGIEKLNTSNVTNMNNLFAGCSSMVDFDFLSVIDTSKVEKMSGMFSGCIGLTDFTVPAMNTSSVKDMSGMFNGCSGLTKLVFPITFDTSKVTSMADMFKNCINLTEIDLSAFNTENVTTMSLMFRGCEKLTELDLSGFNTSKVQDFYGTFAHAKVLQRIYASDKWSNISVKNSGYMFENCPVLKGGNGTAWKDIKNSDEKEFMTAKYAVIDKSGQQGYFTAPLCEHSATAFADNGDGTHSCVCTDCGELVETADHDFSNNNTCTCKVVKITDGTPFTLEIQGDVTSYNVTEGMLWDEWQNIADLGAENYNLYSEPNIGVARGMCFNDRETGVRYILCVGSAANPLDTADPMSSIYKYILCTEDEVSAAYQAGK